MPRPAGSASGPRSCSSAPGGRGDRGRLSRCCVLRPRLPVAPELFQLVATFGVILVIQDLSAAGLGAGRPASVRRAPGLDGYAGRDHGRPGSGIRPRALIAITPVPCSIGLWYLITRTRWSASWCAPRPRTARWSARSGGQSGLALHRRVFSRIDAGRVWGSGIAVAEGRCGPPDGFQHPGRRSSWWWSIGGMGSDARCPDRRGPDLGVGRIRRAASCRKARWS